MALRKRITDLLSSQPGNALGAVDLEEKLDMAHVPVMNALLALRKKGVIKALGERPYRYVMNDGSKPHISPQDFVEGPQDGPTAADMAKEIAASIEKVLGPVAIKVYKLIQENNHSPLNAREVAERLKVKLTGARYFLSILKKKGVIKSIGVQPWHYAVNDLPVKVEKKPVKKQPKKTRAKKKSPETVEKSYPTMKEFDEYLMVYITKESDIPLLQSFHDPVKFSKEFENQQQRPDLVKITGYRRLQCRKRVIFTPEIK